MGKNNLERCKSLRLFRTALLAFCLLAGMTASAAPLTVSGTVTQASDGEPLVGVSVLIKGSSQGTSTDIDGNYTLKADEGATLVFSYVGFTTREIKVTSERMDVALVEDSEVLDEVVVVGYGVQKKKLVTGATAQIKGDDIAKMNTTSPLQAMQGQLPGVNIASESGQPGAAMKVTIRGLGTTGNAQPLYLIDGIGGDISTLNPADIENITILKDASAAVYGFKGANGVILVTTKRGEAGKPKINYNGYVGIQNITRYPEYYNGYEYATLYNEAQQNIGVSAPYSAEDLERFRQGIGTTDWYDEVIRKTAPATYHNLSVSGGAEKVKYFFSLGLTDQEGIYKSGAFNYKKYNVRSNISAEVVKGFKVDLQLSGRLDTRMKPYEAEPLSRSIQMAKPIFPIHANDNPDYWSNPGDKGNPVHLSDIDNVGYDRRDRREFNGSITLNWEIPWVKGLSAKALLSYDYNNKYSRNGTKSIMNIPTMPSTTHTTNPAAIPFLN